MAITQVIHLTQDKHEPVQIAYAVQNDTGRILKMVIDDETLASGNTGVVSFKRSDESTYNQSATLALADNAFTADITQGCTQSGITECQLKVTASSKVISSYTFLLMVQPDVYGLDPVAQAGYDIDDLIAAAATLSLDNVPKVTSFDGGTALGSQTINTICRIYQEVGLTDLPSGVDIANHIAWLYTIGTDTAKHQMLFVPYQNGFYQRLYRNSSWSDWTGVNDSNTLTVASYDGGTVLGNQTNNRLVRVYGVSGITDAPAGVDLESYPGWLWTYGGTNKHQILFYPHTAAAFQRLYRQSSGTYSWSDWVSLDEGKEFKMLCIGNSFNQDVMAYVPPILQEIMPDVHLTVSLLYEDSADYQKHLTMATAEPPVAYTTWDEWKSYHWVRHQKSNNASLTLQEALSLEDWDLITMQCASKDVVSDNNIATSITKGRQLMRLIQQNLTHPAQLATFAFVGRPLTYDGVSYSSAEMTAKIMDATDTIMQSLGFIDYLPIANAIGGARTNDTLAALGDAGDLLFDNHLQNGIPDLISAYVICLKILEWEGNKHKGVYGSTFVPNAATLEYINAKKGGMTHGDPVGEDDPAKIRAAQEIATLAVRNPGIIPDCTDILI